MTSTAPPQHEPVLSAPCDTGIGDIDRFRAHHDIESASDEHGPSPIARHFGDEFVICGGESRLTALGEAFLPRVGRLPREVDDSFNLTLDFDPATAKRTIALTAPEAMADPMLCCCSTFR